MIGMIIFIMIGMVIEYTAVKLTGHSLVNATIKVNWRAKLAKFFKGSEK